MNSPIRNNHGHHAADLAQQAQAGADHMGQLTQARGFTGVKVQHTKMQRARMQHNKMLAAAFYRGKRFAEGMHKPPPPSAQKLMRQLGQRPRPAGSAKAQGKEASARERPDGQHALEPRHEHEHPHEREREHDQGRQQKQGQQQKRERDQQHGDGQQQHRNGHGHDRGSNPQGEEHGQGQGQPQQSAPRDGQPRRDGRQSGEGRDKPRKFAIGKAGRAKAAARSQPLAATMQLLAKQRLGAPDLPAELAAACAKEVLRLAAQIELGPLLAVPMLLAMRSPMALRRNAARLHAHRHAALMQSAATPGKAAAVAGLLGVSLDNTLARQSAGIEYSYDDQSIAAVKQRILDTQAALPAGGAQAGAAVTGGAIGGQADAARQGAAKPMAGASDKTFEVRMAPAAPTAKP